MPAPKNIPVGSVYTRWTTIADPVSVKRATYSVRVVRCRCRCGVERDVDVGSLSSGKSVSCGCVWEETMKAIHTTHGMCGTPEYESWRAMHSRCYRVASEDYPDYGGRGIKVCDRWRGTDGFANFLADMGCRPSGKFSIDRINVNGDYEPSNCRWATDATQARNRRTNHKIEFRGRVQSVTEWAEEVGIPTNVMFARINLLKWDVERALTTPHRKMKPRKSKRNSPHA